MVLARMPEVRGEDVFLSPLDEFLQVALTGWHPEPMLRKLPPDQVHEFPVVVLPVRRGIDPDFDAARRSVGAVPNQAIAALFVLVHGLFINPESDGPVGGVGTNGFADSQNTGVHSQRLGSRGEPQDIGAHDIEAIFSNNGAVSSFSRDG